MSIALPGTPRWNHSENVILGALRSPSNWSPFSLHPTGFSGDPCKPSRVFLPSTATPPGPRWICICGLIARLGLVLWTFANPIRTLPMCAPPFQLIVLSSEMNLRMSRRLVKLLPGELPCSLCYVMLGLSFVLSDFFRRYSCYFCLAYRALDHLYQVSTRDIVKCCFYEAFNLSMNRYSIRCYR